MIKNPTVVGELGKAPPSDERVDTEISDEQISESLAENNPADHIPAHLQPLKASSPSEKKLKKCVAKKTLHSSIIAAELSDDNDSEFEKVLESKTLKMQYMDSGRTSKASIIQKEAVPKENTQKKFEVLPFGKDLDRFKKNFKRFFDRREAAAAAMFTKSTAVMNNSVTNLKAKNFGEPSMGPQKPSQINLQQLSKLYASSSYSKSNTGTSENLTLQSYKKNGSVSQLSNKFYYASGAEPKVKGLDLKSKKLNGSYELENHPSYTKLSKEQEHFQSLSINYGPNSKEFISDEVQIQENKAHITEHSYHKGQDILFTHVTKTHESYAFIPTDNSLLLPSNLMNVLEHMEKDKSYAKNYNQKENRVNKSTDKFASLIGKLENNKNVNANANANKKSVDNLKKASVMPKKANVSALNLHIETDPFEVKQEKGYADFLFGLDESDAEDSMNKKSFAIRHQLQLDSSSDRQGNAGEDRDATEGNNSSSNLNHEFDFEDTKADEIPEKKVDQTATRNIKRWQNHFRSYKVSNVQNHQSSPEKPQSQSFMVNYNSSSQLNIHKNRKYRAYRRSSEQKSFMTNMGDASLEDYSVLTAEDKDNKHADSLSPLKQGDLTHSRQWNNRKLVRAKKEETSVLQQSMMININRIIAQSKQNKTGENPPREKKMIAKVTQLYLCYGEQLKASQKERPRSNISHSRAERRPIH